MENKILVISEPALILANRKIYDLLKANNYSIELVIPEVKNFLESPKFPKIESKYKIHSLPLANLNSRIYYYYGLNELLEKIQPKIIYLDNEPISLLAYLLGRWCKKNGAKLICQSNENLPVSIKSHYIRRSFKGIAPGILKYLLIKLTISLVDHIFTINNAGVIIHKNIGYRSVSKICLGFDPKLFNIDETTRNEYRYKLDIDGVAIGYFGRMVPEKGVEFLIKALSKVNSLNWTLVIDDFQSDKNDYSKKIISMIKTCRIIDRVRFFEASHDEIYKYMNAVDITVLPSISTPSWMEQYGRVIPESMACGCAIIASNTGALPELIGSNGVLVDEGDVESLKKQLSNLIQNQEAREIYAKLAYSHAHKNLSIEQQYNLMRIKFDEYLKEN